MMRKTVRYWTLEEQMLLLQNSKLSLKELSKLLGRSTRSISGYAALHRIPIGATRQRWTPDDITFLRINAHRGAHYIARYLGRTHNAVTLYASRHNIPLGDTDA